MQTVYNAPRVLIRVTHLTAVGPGRSQDRRMELEAKIARLDTKIERWEAKVERVEQALAEGTAYLGTTDHVRTGCLLTEAAVQPAHAAGWLVKAVGT